MREKIIFLIILNNFLLIVTKIAKDHWEIEKRENYDNEQSNWNTKSMAWFCCDNFLISFIFSFVPLFFYLDSWFFSHFPIHSTRYIIFFFPWFYLLYNTLFESFLKKEGRDLERFGGVSTSSNPSFLIPPNWRDFERE